MIRKLSLMTAAAVLLSTLGVAASPREHSVYLTFDKAVEIPGATLAPGTYIFEEADPTSSSNVVRVLSRDRSRVFLTQFATPVERPAGLGDEEAVIVGEAQPNQPEPILSWFAPGADVGYALRYDAR